MTPQQFNIKYLNREISKIELLDDSIEFHFSNSINCVKVADHGQDCCELRYPSCDDDLRQFVGADFLGCEELSPQKLDCGLGDVHEILFFRVLTSVGDMRFSFHNEHNGYYSGFGMDFEEISRQGLLNV